MEGDGEALVCSRCGGPAHERITVLPCAAILCSKCGDDEDERMRLRRCECNERMRTRESVLEAAQEQISQLRQRLADAQQELAILRELTGEKEGA